MKLKKLFDIKSIEPLRITTTALEWHCFIPPNKTMQPGIIRWSKLGIILLGNLIFTFIPLARLVYEEAINKKWMQMSSTLADALCLAGVCMALIFATIQHRRYIILFKSVADHSEYGVPENFLSERYRLNLLAYINYIYLMCSCAIKQLLAILNEEHCVKATQEFRFDVICNAFVPVPWLFDVDSPWLKFLWRVVQLGFAYITLAGVATGAYMIYEFSCYIVVRVQYLNSKLLVMFDTDSKSIQKNNFRECVKMHNVCCDHASTLDAGITHIMFVHFSVTAVILGLYANLIIKRLTEEFTLEVVGDVMYCLGWFFALFFACFSGENIKSVFEETSAILYQAKWYSVDVSLRKSYRIMQFKCMRPVVMTTGAFGTLSFALFVSIMKTTYSYIALIQQTMD